MQGEIFDSRGRSHTRSGEEERLIHRYQLCFEQLSHTGTSNRIGTTVAALGIGFPWQGKQHYVSSYETSEKQGWVISPETWAGRRDLICSSSFKGNKVAWNFHCFKTLINWFFLTMVCLSCENVFCLIDEILKREISNSNLNKTWGSIFPSG